MELNEVVGKILGNSGARMALQSCPPSRGNGARFFSRDCAQGVSMYFTRWLFSAEGNSQVMIHLGAIRQQRYQQRDNKFLRPEGEDLADINIIC